MKFQELGLIAPILKALDYQGYTTPTPIQRMAIPPALEGRDVLGCAQTGTGKTCAFATPILQRLHQNPRPGARHIRALILTPTRELALQIQESFAQYGANLPLRSAVIFGGVGQAPQVDKIKRGLDILVATPGRLLDLQGQGLLDLSHVELFVLDEADRMLDMGFVHDVRRVLKLLPGEKQTLFFSATMPPEVMDLVNGLLKNPARVAVDPVSSPVEIIDQSVYFVDKKNKSKLLARLIEAAGGKSALVFTRTKHGANKVAADLEKAGISASAIHGNKSQTARQQALSSFKAGTVRALVATDIAARGIDIEELALVFNYNLPEVPETYVHRIGRTGRAGHDGRAVSFCDFGEKVYLKGIEKLLKKSIPVVDDHPWPMEVFEEPKDARGRPINADDAEARTAARDRRRARAAAAPKPAQAKAKAPQAKASQAKQPRQSAAVTAPTAPAAKRRGQKWSKAMQPSALDTVLPERSAATQQLPLTSHKRTNPLADDRIMDATARLLAPKPLTLQHNKAPATKKPAAQRAEKHKGAAEARTRGQGTRSQTGQAKRPSQGGRGGQGRRPVTPQKSGAVKDSTEQPSLMKPYYMER